MRIYWLQSITLLYLSNSVNTQYDNGYGQCMLLPSELGPDWYKVPQPAPPGMEVSFTHMPCAPTTVFEVSVCGCTNLLSFLFSVSGTQRTRIVSEPTESLIAPGDVMKKIDPKESQPPEPTGSLLLNTKTGEVRKCPFRASSRGNRWYLVREHGDTWRPMECAAGTLFDKVACTCIHQALAARGPSAPEDKDIVIIEEAFESFGPDKENTISESLAIKVKDVDFGVDPKDIPFWRRPPPEQSHNEGKHPPNIIDPVTPDVRVTLNHYEHQAQSGNANQRTLFQNTGDRISEAHRALLSELRKGPRGVPYKRKSQAAPLFLDRVTPRGTSAALAQSETEEDHPLDVSLNITKHIQRPIVTSVKRPRKIVDSEGRVIKTDNKVSHIPSSDDGDNRHFKETKPNAQNNGLPRKEEDTSEMLDKELKSLMDLKVEVDKVTLSKQNLRHLDDVLQRSECLKKPMPGPDPHYFLLPVPGVGYIPYTCHGNYVYDHSICSCRKAQGETSYNEEAFPFRECKKQPLPEFGPKFFKAHILGFGYIPIGCHGDTLFNEYLCACVS